MLGGFAITDGICFILPFFEFALPILYLVFDVIQILTIVGFLCYSCLHVCIF
jgi:hypothetical protein